MKAAQYRTAAVSAVMREDDLEEHVRELSRPLGILRFHTRNSRHSPKGWVDDVLLGRRGALFRELKTQTGTVTPAQAECIDRLRALGFDVDVWRPADLVSGRIATELRGIA